MKIRHLLLGLIICVAGTGAIDLSLGYLDDPNLNQTPFLIFGHVLYEGGAPCNSPNVSITNLNTGVAWYADTVSDSNYYQNLLRAADVAAGDLLEFDVTDGAGFNSTNHTVGQGDLESGGIFDFDMILQSIAPGITGYAPESPIRDIENVTRRFNITIDQVVDVTWLINSSPAQTNESVTAASYTHTNVAIGVWNISARASNENGTAMQEWIWDITTLPLPKITAFATPPSVFVIYGNVSYGDGSVCNSPFVVITNLNTSEELIADNRTGEGFYQLVTSSAFANESDMLRINAHKNGMLVGNATRTVSQIDIRNGMIKADINERYLPDFTVANVSFDPSEPLLIGDLVTINAMITNSGESEGKTSVEFYDNKSITIERTQSDNYERPINDTLTLPDILRIRVRFESFDISSGGNITICNESQMVERITRNGWTKWCDGDTVRIESWNSGFTVDRYEAVLANESITLGGGYSTNRSAKWDLSLQEMGWATNGTHNISVRVDPYDQVIESNETNNDKTEVIDVSPSLDFAVTKISPDPDEPALGDAVEVSANITNYGNRSGTTVVGVFYDNISVEIERVIEKNYTTMETLKNYTYTDNILLPSGVLGARLHFKNLYVVLGRVDICDSNGRVVERIEVNKNNYWTDYIYTDNITVRAELIYTEGWGGYNCSFTIDRYEALIAEEPVTLNATESKVINAPWRTGAAHGGAGYRNITVMVDLHNHSVETNETNNTLSEQAFVNGTDLAVTKIEIAYDLCYVGQDVPVTATIVNLGAVDATNFTVIFKDGTCFNCSEENINTSGTPFTEYPIERLDSGESRSIPVIWNPAEINYRTITASIPYDNTDNNGTNNELPNCTDVIARYDFLVEGVSVEPPKEVRRGESVDITATIGSIGYESENVSVAFFVNSTDFAGTYGDRFTRIGTIDDVYVKVNETETVSMTWDVDVAGGCHLIAAVVNPDNEVEEVDGTVYLHDTIRFRGETGNNVKNCTLHVTPLDLDITEITLAPAEPNIGDIVDVSATIKNNGSAANSTVRFYMEKDESISGTSHNTGNEPPPTWKWSPSIPPEVPIRFHVNSIEMGGNSEGYKGGEVNAFVTDGEGHNQKVHFYIKCEDCGGQDVKVSTIDFYTAGFSEIDNYNRRWDDVWTDWTDGTTFEINAISTDVFGGGGSVYAIVSFSIDKYQVRLGNETVTLYPDDSDFYNSTWNTSTPLNAGEYYRLMANVENQKIDNNGTYLGGTDLAVTDVSLKSPVYDGDTMWVNATIENLGRMGATDFIVNFTEVYTPIRTIDACDNLELINTTRIEGLDIGNSINISVLWNGSIRDIEWEGSHTGDDSCPSWTEYGCDNYSIRVEINPLENENKEEDVANNSKEQGVHVDRSRDFKIRGLSFRVNDTYCNSSELVIYDDLTLNATLDITNLANQGGVVDVGFYIDDPCDTHKIGNTTVAFPAGNGTGYAEIEWKVDSFDDVDIIGSHNMTVVVDPENRIYEINESNNVTPYPINVMASDPLVERLDIHPVNPEGGEAVSIEATIANYGAVDAGDVTLTIYDWAERHIEDLSEQSGMGGDQIRITRSDAAAMKLYLDLEVGNGCEVCINDCSGKEIVCYHENFYGWTPWVLDNNITIVVMNNGTDVAYAEVSKVYYLVSSSSIDTSRHDLGVNVTKKIAVNWTPLTVGERLVAAIIDPDDLIAEQDKSNNMRTELVQVQTADLEVSDLSLTWLNGTEIGKHEIVKDGADVRISANISNIGVNATGSFDVRLLAGDLLIESVNGSLAPNDSICWSENWSVTVGNHLLKVEADYGNEINETNETNNIAARKLHVRGAELSGNISWETLGLHGERLSGPDQPYDGDEVVITAIVNNSGYVPAENFSTVLFFDYEPYTYHKSMDSYGQRWINKSYDDAVCIYLNIDIDSGYMIFTIYNGNDTEVKSVDKSCWVRVQGDAVSVLSSIQYFSSYMIDFYPIYPGDLSQIMKLDVNSSIKLPPIQQNVSVGDYPIILFIDPENKAPEAEDYREDNIIARTMQVKPTRDFTVTSVAGERTNLSDLDTQTITAGVSNIGLRNGTASVSFVDSEEESCRYRYHFDTNRSPSYLPIPPDAKLSGLQYDEYTPRYYDNLTIIHRPGVDAIDLHFSIITLSKQEWSTPAGRMDIFDDNGSRRWYAQGPDFKAEKPTIFHDEYIPVPGETAYIYTNNYTSFDLDWYTTETEFHREEVQLNASTTWNESKNITPIWTAYTGYHNITVTLDEDDKITEISESNNELSSIFHVTASRDPVIVGLNTTPENPEEGDNVDITAVVENNGYKNVSFTVDLWANLTRKKPGADESLPKANLTTNLSGDRVRYITLLNHTTVTLAPGENTTVNATWNDISIAGDPTHHIIAIVDPTDEIDETNESNNEIVRKITPDYPDLTIGTAHVRGGTGEAVVPIIEIGGASGASDVTVRFEAYETEKCTKFIQGRRWIRHSGANNMQVYFDHLKGPVEVKDSSNPRKLAVETYGADEEFSGVWGPWVKGDAVYIICRDTGAYAEIDKYRWGNVSDAEQFDLPAGGRERVEMPWPYEYPRMINVTVDPYNNITEINEGNNEKSVLEYADLRAERIEFVSPQDTMLSLDAEKFEIEGTIVNRGDEDGIRSVSDFNVTLEFREWHYSNGTDGDAVFNITEHVEEPLYDDEERTIMFEFDPSEKFEIDGKYGNYSVFLIADSSGDIRESSELYCPEGESNNDTRYVDRYGNEYVRIYSESGYTGGGELINVGQGEVHGRVVYTIGDSRYDVLTPPGGEETVRYAEVIPDDADIEFARIFLYWFMYHEDPNRPDEYAFISEIADVDVTFNGHSLDMAVKYNDTPGVGADYGYGLYSYDVKDQIIRGENVATVANNAEWDMGVHAIGLLVVYEDEDEPLTKYWVNEGADIVMAANGEYNGGLPSGDCITTAIFEDVKRDDTENVSATLLTVMGMYRAYSLDDLFSNPGDALEFNYQSIGSRIGTGYWEHHYSGSGIALTRDEWDDVTDHLRSGANHADIHSFGNYMMPNNAFLRLIFPPDLAITNLTAPASTVVGAHHSINTTIRNDGRSDAHDFNVTFYIDGKQMVRIPHLNLPAGENMTLHLYNWTPMLLMHVYNLTAAADALSGEDWAEVETDNNAMTKHVPIEEGGFGNQTGPRGTGGGSNPTGGVFTEEITGRVMQGIKDFLSGGGGGGAGMFSLTEWIMKGAVWLVLLLFVGLGYRMEQRSWGRVSAGYAGYAGGL